MGEQEIDYHLEWARTTGSNMRRFTAFCIVLNLLMFAAYEWRIELAERRIGYLEHDQDQTLVVIKKIVSKLQSIPELRRGTSP